MSVYNFNKFSVYLDSRARESWGEVTRLASAAGCQHSYLSRALRDEVLLTPDHLYKLCGYWQLSDKESDYLFLLLTKDRAATSEYRANLQQRIAKIQREQENIARRLLTPRIVSPDFESIYYSSWHWAAIHLCTSIASLQTEKAIADSLNIKRELVKVTLTQLETWSLVKRHGNHWRHTATNFYLPKSSPLIAQHHRQWRQRAADDSLIPDGNGLHYTQVQAMDEKAYVKIKEILLGSIDQSIKIADDSKSEKIVTVVLDAFQIC